MKKGNAITMNVVDTIMAAASEAGINENWCLIDNQSTRNAFISRNNSQISEMPPMGNIYVSIVTQE